MAKLYLGINGQAEVVHVDLSSPDTPYEPAIDVAAGFSAAAQRYSAPIVPAELYQLLGRAHEVGLENFAVAKECFLRLSHECWGGRKAEISLAEVLSAFQEDLDISPRDKERLRSFLLP